MQAVMGGRGGRVLVAVLVMFMGGLAVTGRAAATTFSFGTPSTIAGSLTPNALSCSSFGNCAAIGPLGSGVGAQSEINGAWQTPIVLSVPSGLTSGVTAQSVSCTSDGNCVAVGSGCCTDNAPGSQQLEPLVWTESGGSWGAGAVVPLPGDADTASNQGEVGGRYTSVACASSSYCVATGVYTNSSQLTEGMVASGALAAPSGEPGLGYLLAAGCTPGTSTCLIGGKRPFATGAPNHAFVATDTNGAIGAPTDLTPSNSDPSGTSVAQIACPDGPCTVAGYVNQNTGHPQQALTVQQNGDGTWQTANALTTPIFGSYTQVSGLSCVDSGDCLLVGTYDNSGATQEYAMQASETGGSFSAAQQLATPSGGSQFGQTFAAGVGCVAVGCTINGHDSNGSWGESVTTGRRATSVSPTCTEAAPGSTVWQCAVSVRDASGSGTPGTPTGSVTWASSSGTFPSGAGCALGPASPQGSATCSVLLDPGTETGTPVTVAASYPGDQTFLANQGQATFTPQCAQDPSETDGSWQFTGCFVNPDSTDYDTSVNSSIDGLTVSPSDASDHVDYSTGGSGGETLGSSGATSLSADLSSISGGSLGSVVLQSALQRLNLSTGSVTITPPSGFTLAGVSVSGTMTVTAQAGGSATATATATLPGVLGGGPASLTMTTVAGKGVTSLTVTATSGSLANVFGLSSLTLNYSPSGWTVAATASGAGGSKQTLNGSISYDSSGKLKAGSLVINNVVLAGLLQVRTFKVSYSSSGWSGAADLAQGKQAASVTLAFTTAGVMTSGSISAKGITLWQVFELKSFAMTYAPDGTWGLKLSVAGKKGSPSVDASLAVRDGTVRGADLDFKNVLLLSKVTVDDLHLTYAHAAGHDLFSGSTKLTLPGTAVSKVDGSFATVDGQLTKASLDLYGNVPLYGALTLNHLGASVTLKPNKEISGRVGLSAGPKTSKGELLGLDHGTVTYRFPVTAHGAGDYTFSGDLEALGRTLGQGRITIHGAVAKLELTLGKGGKGFAVGKHLEINGSITGGLRGHTFTARGAARLEFAVGRHNFAVRGSVVTSNNGLTACAAVPQLARGNSGATYSWDGSITVYKGDCPF